MISGAERPIGVTILAILVAVQGALALLNALGIFGPEPATGVALILAVVFALVLLYLAYGLWTLQSWAWTATLILMAVNGIFALLAVLSFPAAIGAWIQLILAAVIIFYLTRPEVKEAFGR